MDQVKAPLRPGAGLAVSWSGGKDSCLACYRAKAMGFEVSYLLSMISEEFKRSGGHGIYYELMYRQSEAIGIPMVQRQFVLDNYEEEFKRGLRGAAGLVTGDIHLEEGRDWVERVCQESGIRALMPLWGEDVDHLLTEFIEEGFEAVLVSARADLFGEEWLGRKIDKSFIQDLPQLPGPPRVDLCGELGEYHTFVTDGPLFKKRINILETGTVLKKDYWFLDIVKYDLVAKRRPL